MGIHLPVGALSAIGLAACCVVSFMSIRPLGRWCALLYALSVAACYLVIGNLTMPIGAALMSILIGRHARTRIPPGEDRGAEFGLQFAMVMVGLAAYTTARHFIESDPGPASSNAQAIIDFERGLGLYFEPRLQSWAMNSEAVIRWFNWFYSFTFLTFIAMVLLWLWAADSKNYRLFRNSLGLSVLPALLTIALFAVAPPRLLETSELIDTIAFYGREHAFANEYAAVPSLHVGWMALAGVVLARSIGGRWSWAIALAPGSLMMLTVIVTGNHYWIDGLIGAVYAVGAAVALTARQSDGVAQVTARSVASASRATGRLIAACALTLASNARAQFSVISLGLLLTYMIGMQITAPGFTDFWLYLVLQTAGFMLALLLGEVVFAKEGGLSWLTHVIAVTCTFADVLGTDGNLYNRIDEYDKITHFVGTAAITAGAYDVLRALYVRGTIPWDANERLTLSVALGMAAGVGWEIYELLADKVFQTGRVQGVWDTGNDLISDALGAVGVAALLWFAESQRMHQREGALHPPDDVRQQE